jgi:hypothetical protein
MKACLFCLSLPSFSLRFSVTSNNGRAVQDTLLAFGQLVVAEQENVRRVQLANEYLSSAALAGADGSAIPEAVRV